uniref:Uncharacterized protein LOC104228532 n=1 Tax=Nicotiana sylvestris TaxID=4096 RepID=A0A1U7WL65_NICSY|nr:PREDICTED: uncharacterized protein LOC104228532 [Nicotiana sylvestris]
MFARFSKIISDLKAFGKPYSSGDQDLNKLSYNELRGELIAFEKTYLKKTNQEENKKTIAFKATTKIAENDIDDDPEALQEEITMLSRNMDGLMRRFRNMRRGRIQPRRSRQYNEQDKIDEKCSECERFGHIQAECPDLIRKISRGFWTDEDTSDYECKDNNENCFMARGETSEKGKRPNISYFHPVGSKCFTQNISKDNLGKFDTRSDEEESVHVIFDENNSSTEKGTTVGDEDQSQEIQETSKSQKSTDGSDAMIELTNEISNNLAEHPKESTTHTVHPNEWKNEPEYPKKFIIWDPNKGMKTRGALKKKANIALISQIEPKKIEEALKGSSCMQEMPEELDQFDKNQVWKLISKP